MEITAHHGLLHDTHLHVDDYGGSGRPVVLIHGWPLNGESWSEQIEPLQSAGYRVVTYDRRGFGRSDKPKLGYGYDTLAEDLEALLEALELQDVTLVGFSMGGGEVARYLSRYGAGRIHSVVFAAAVPPYLMKGSDNPDGPLEKSQAAEFTGQLTTHEKDFYDFFITQFLTAGDTLTVPESTRQETLALTEQADHLAALETMTAWASTDFRSDLESVTVPALIIHGDSDALVPFEGSGKRTHEAIPGSQLHLITGGPHGINLSHRDEFNRVLIDFLAA